MVVRIRPITLTVTFYVLFLMTLGVVGIGAFYELEPVLVMGSVLGIITVFVGMIKNRYHYKKKGDSPEP